MLGNYRKPLLAEMLVECEDLFDAQLAHGLKTAAIHKRELTAVGSEKPSDNGFMSVFVNPGNFKEWNKIGFKTANHIHSKPILDERECFHDNVIIGDKPAALHNKTIPQIPSLIVVLFGGICQAKERGGIYEDFFHEP